jgi:RND family efflux transporter MFP subunit
VALAVGGVIMSGLLTYKPETPAAAKVPPVNVRVMPLRQIPEMPDTFDLPAVVEANRVVTVSAEVAGRIEQINCKEGETCMSPADSKSGKPPTPLIVLNTDLIRAELERAQAEAERAKKNHGKVERLWKQGAGTEQGVIDAKADMIATRAAEKLANVRLKRASILPPISGVLDQIMVEQGEYVQVGDPVAKIVDIDTVKVVAMVPEQDIAYIKIGSPGQVFADSRHSKPDHTGAVTYISQLADRRTRATRVEITLNNKRRTLRSGRILKIRLTRRVLHNVLMVPLEAVIPLENGKAVYVVEKGQDGNQVARRRKVRVNTRLIKPAPKPEGMGGDPEKTIQTIQILPWPASDKRRGVRAGDRLIIKGHPLVAPGQAVTITDGRSKTTATTPPATGGRTGDDSE